jgi:hypothetical protein
MRRSPLLLLSLLASCSFDRGTLNVHLTTSPLAYQNPLPDSQEAADNHLLPIKRLAIRVEGDDMGVRQQEFEFTRHGAAVTLPEIPVGSRRTISVEGLGQVEGADQDRLTVLSRGSTLPLDIVPGRNSVTLFVGLVGRFSSTPTPMREARAFHAAVLLNDGRLMLFGGASAIERTGSPFKVSAAVNTVEVLDPTAVSFDTSETSCDVARPLDCMSVPRALATATQLPSGILVAGGESEAEIYNDAELFDPARRLFAPGGVMREPHSRHAAVRTGSAAVILGGRRSEPADEAWPDLADVIERFENGRFGGIGQMPEPREAASATVLADERILVAGGLNAQGQPVATAEIYEEGSVVAAVPLATARAYHTATLLDDGRVLILGGLTSASPGEAYAEVFDPTSESFMAVEVVADDLYSRWAHAATVLPDSRILVTGGFVAGPIGGARADAFIANAAALSRGGAGPATGLSETRLSYLSTGRAGHSSTLLGNGHVLIAGGVGQDGRALSSAEVLVLER